MTTKPVQCWTYLGEGAELHARAKIRALGPGAELLTPEQAEEQGWKAPRFADGVKIPVEWIVVQLPPEEELQEE